MSTIYENDYTLLAAEGWEQGAYWSAPGSCGYYIRHAEHTGNEWIKVDDSPCSEDSLQDDEGFVGPSGACDSASEALMDRINIEEEEE